MNIVPLTAQDSLFLWELSFEWFGSMDIEVTGGDNLQCDISTWRRLSSPKWVFCKINKIKKFREKIPSIFFLPTLTMVFISPSTNIFPIYYLYFGLLKFAKKGCLQKYYMREVKHLSKRKTQLINELFWTSHPSFAESLPCVTNLLSLSWHRSNYCSISKL